VHNAHTEGILGKLLSDVKYADLLSKLSKLDELQEGLGAKMGDFIEQWGSEAEIKKLLDKLNDVKHFDELKDRLKRTAESVNIRKLKKEVTPGQSRWRIVSDCAKKNFEVILFAFLLLFHVKKA
jgi:hypothetical protein